MNVRYGCNGTTGSKSAPTGSDMSVGEAITRMAFLLNQQEITLLVFAHKIAQQEVAIARLRTAVMVGLTSFVGFGLMALMMWVAG